MNHETWRLGNLLEHIHFDSLDIWRQKHAPSCSLEDLFAGEVKQVDEQLLHFPGGRLHIICTVQGKRIDSAESYFFRVQRIAPAEYIVKDASFDL